MYLANCAVVREEKGVSGRTDSCIDDEYSVNALAEMVPTTPVVGSATNAKIGRDCTVTYIRAVVVRPSASLTLTLTANVPTMLNVSRVEEAEGVETPADRQLHEYASVNGALSVVERAAESVTELKPAVTLTTRDVRGSEEDGRVKTTTGGRASRSDTNAVVLCCSESVTVNEKV